MAAQKPIAATTIQSTTASSTAATMAGQAATDRTTPKMGLGSLTDSTKLSEGGQTGLLDPQIVKTPAVRLHNYVLRSGRIGVHRVRRLDEGATPARGRDRVACSATPCRQRNRGNHLAGPRFAVRSVGQR
jgi:hypothetical protein